MSLVLGRGTDIYRDESEFIHENCDNAFYSVCFRDMELKILGISDAEKVLDAVKDYVENGEVWV